MCVKQHLFLALRCLHPEEHKRFQMRAPELTRNNITIFGMAVAYIINIFLFLWSAFLTA